jgi:hypothetical protein
MNRTLPVLALAALTFAATGCQKKTVPSSFRPAGTQTITTAYIAGKIEPQQQPERFVAERDAVTVATPASQLQQAWESTVAFCATIQCEVVSSNLSTQTGQSDPSANVSVRVAPGAQQNLINHVQQLGKIVQHTTNRDDETDQVIDSDAKIKNLTAFRDNLRAMLARPNVTVGNLIQINQQLTDTQSELDSQTAQRKVLANQTEKIAVDISFGAERNVPTGLFAAIWSALVYVGDTLGESLATLVTVVLFLIPWVILLFLIVGLTIKVRRRSRRQVPPPSPAST